jgi:hypothetical protein
MLRQDLQLLANLIAQKSDIINIFVSNTLYDLFLISTNFLEPIMDH